MSWKHKVPVPVEPNVLFVQVSFSDNILPAVFRIRIVSRPEQNKTWETAINGHVWNQHKSFSTSTGPGTLDQRRNNSQGLTFLGISTSSSSLSRRGFLPLPGRLDFLLAASTTVSFSFCTRQQNNHLSNIILYLDSVTDSPNSMPILVVFKVTKICIIEERKNIEGNGSFFKTLVANKRLS